VLFEAVGAGAASSLAMGKLQRKHFRNAHCV
jgi:hypothetical protein